MKDGNALCTWFLMAAGSERNDTYTIYDVPIEVTLSAEAEADGLRVFNKSYSTADIEVSGNSLITSKLTADDFRVTASLNRQHPAKIHRACAGSEGLPPDGLCSGFLQP